MRPARYFSIIQLSNARVVLEDMVIPDGSLAAGNPAKIKRLLTEEERAKLYDTSLSYMVTGRKLKKDGYCI